MKTMSRILGAALLFVGTTATSALADEKMELDQVPAEVKATIDKHVGDGKLEYIEKEMKGGKTVFEVDFEDKNGKDHEILVAEDGKLLSKKRD
jgi:uncharacterized membrane protein YkoI